MPEINSTPTVPTDISRSTLNASVLETEIYWFNRVIQIGNDNPDSDLIYSVPPADFSGVNAPYSNLIHKYQLDFDERFVLILALIPHLKPDFLDTFFQKNPETNRYMTELGGRTGKGHSGFLPTGETAIFLLAKRDLEKRLKLMRLFSADHAFCKHNILELSGVERGEPRTSGMLTISSDFLEQVINERKLPPKFSSDFPAKQLSTRMEWNDLVLSPTTLSEINDLRIWLEHHNTLLNVLGMQKKLTPGYKVLFHGLSGTGKTLTACLLGKEINRDVYRIDLSMVVSKYIGETEKNLARVFDKAENTNWILFFDEADALFGSRTKVESSHDRYANQEVSYLLQRIEDYNGLVILASNLKDNIDQAFIRRFQSIVHFPSPKSEERHRLWKKSFPEQILLDGGISLQQISRDYELTGAHIANIAAHCTLHALANGNNKVTLKMLRESIGRELAKEGRSL